ncbi:hypothetical protein TWF718_005100 [Orbilia javanica]|uniref:C2H2-type domain-containing protein n=1 Tax=Orbilia javanica TaxID=47235 RepID=A0AAN8RLL3_9PEZI
MQHQLSYGVQGFIANPSSLPGCVMDSRRPMMPASALENPSGYVIGQSSDIHAYVPETTASPVPRTEWPFLFTENAMGFPYQTNISPPQATGPVGPIYMNGQYIDNGLCAGAIDQVDPQLAAMPVLGESPVIFSSFEDPTFAQIQTPNTNYPSTWAGYHGFPATFPVDGLQNPSESLNTPEQQQLMFETVIANPPEQPYSQGNRTPRSVPAWKVCKEIYPFGCEEVFRNEKERGKHIYEKHTFKAYECPIARCPYRTSRHDNVKTHRINNCKYGPSRTPINQTLRRRRCSTKGLHVSPQRTGSVEASTPPNSPTDIAQDDSAEDSPTCSSQSKVSSLGRTTSFMPMGDIKYVAANALDVNVNKRSKAAIQIENAILKARVEDLTRKLELSTGPARMSLSP